MFLLLSIVLDKLIQVMSKHYLASSFLCFRLMHFTLRIEVGYVVIEKVQ